MMCAAPNAEALRQHAREFQLEHPVNADAPIAPNWVMSRDDQGNAALVSSAGEGAEATPQGGLLEDLCWLGGGLLGCVVLAVLFLMSGGLTLKAVAQLLWRAQ